VWSTINNIGKRNNLGSSYWCIFWSLALDKVARGVTCHRNMQLPIIPCGKVSARSSASLTIFFHDEMDFSRVASNTTWKVTAAMNIIERSRNLFRRTAVTPWDQYEYTSLSADRWTRVIELHLGLNRLTCSLHGIRIPVSALSVEVLSYI